MDARKPRTLTLLDDSGGTGPVYRWTLHGTAM